MSFSASVRAGLPAALHLPDAFALAMGWRDDAGAQHIAAFNPGISDDTAPDPIRGWFEVQMPTQDGPLIGMSPDAPFVIDTFMRETFSKDDLDAIRTTFKYVVEKE